MTTATRHRQLVTTPNRGTTMLDIINALNGQLEDLVEDPAQLRSLLESIEARVKAQLDQSNGSTSSTSAASAATPLD